MVILLLCVALFNYGCAKHKTRSVTFRDFNLFNLIGIDTLKAMLGETYVQVDYLGKVPVNITYKTPQSSISIVLEDSFFVNRKPVFEYSTENLHGGGTGRQYNHGWGFEASKYMLYIANTDTIVCKNYNMLDTSDHSFLLNLYIRKKDRIVNFAGPAGESSNNSNIAAEKAIAYRQYFNLLKSSFTQTPASASIESNILPYPKQIIFYGHLNPQ